MLILVEAQSVLTLDLLDGLSQHVCLLHTCHGLRLEVLSLQPQSVLSIYTQPTQSIYALSLPT